MLIQLAGCTGITSAKGAPTSTNAGPLPAITVQPASQAVTVGQTATFSVAATGTQPLTYQWQKNGIAIPGALSSSYTTPATTSADNGTQFAVVVSNAAGNVTSNAATLTVTAAPVSPMVITQPASQTVAAGQTATFFMTAIGSTPLSYQWLRNGSAIGGATLASYTTPATTTADTGAQFTILVSNIAGSTISSAATLTVTAASVAPSITAQPTNQTATAGQTATFSATASGTAPLSYQWEKNGGNITGATTLSYTTPATTASDNAAQFTVTVSNTTGTVTSSAATLTVNIPPSVTVQPVSQTVAASQTATFSVSASGTSPLSYQWNKNGAAISGASSSTYTTPATTASDNGTQFTVVVSNAVGSTTSSTATLTVTAAVAPSITAQPASQTVIAGQTATFSVTASGTSPLSYQWNKNGGAISGASSSTYTTPATTASDNGAQFTVVVSNVAGNVTSGAATLTVNSAPSITAQPVSQTVIAGQTAAFSVAASGTSPLSYLWNKNGAAISGATSSTYTTPATTGSDNGSQFTVVVSNAAGNVTSSAAILTVNSAPSITAQPISQTVIAGQTSTFSVTASGTPPVSYRWNKNGTAISGATSSTYTTPATTASDNGSQFTVVVSNAAGNVTSSAATLTVNTATFVLGANPTSLSFGNVNTNGSSLLTTTLTNSGNSNVTISNVSISGAGFNASGVSAGLIVTPGQTVTLNVTFAPAATGSVTGNISVLSNASNSPATIGLSGVGVGPPPPTVAITSPLNGATVSGTITVSGTASDSVGVSAVQVQVDSGALSSASGTNSWTFSLDTGSLSNATHSITARATNTSGVTATASISVNVSNSGPTINVMNFGATGNGTTNDTTAIKNAITALSSGATLLFPCGTYLITSQLTVNISNVTLDGSSCATIHDTGSGAIIVIGGSGNGNANLGPAVALSATAIELDTSFATVSSLGVSAGDYIYLRQGGRDSSGGSGNTACDPSGCRGEIVKVASVSGNTINITTAVHDTYNPSLNAATAQKIVSPLTGITVKNITFDGNGSNVYGLEIAGVAESTVSGVTSKNVQGSALLNRDDFNVAWSNITVTGAGSAQCGSAVWFENQGNLSVNGMSISSENPGASGTGCLFNGAFGFELIASANSTITNLTVDAAGAYGRPFKTTAARYNTFNSPIVKNGVQAYNGISLEYYSAHNTYNSCVVTNNGAGTGTGTGNAGIITFGNFNQYNDFNNCTVSGNGNVQFYISGFDALRLAQDSHNNVNGGTFTGSNSVEAVMLIEGDGAFINGATISGPGAQGVYLDVQASNSCVNNNTFTISSGLSAAISAHASGDLGLGNILNGLGSNLTAGICAPPLP